MQAAGLSSTDHLESEHPHVEIDNSADPSLRNRTMICRSAGPGVPAPARDCEAVAFGADLSPQGNDSSAEAAEPFFFSSELRGWRSVTDSLYTSVRAPHLPFGRETVGHQFLFDTFTQGCRHKTPYNMPSENKLLHRQSDTSRQGDISESPPSHGLPFLTLSIRLTPPYNDKNKTAAAPVRAHIARSKKIPMEMSFSGFPVCASSSSRSLCLVDLNSFSNRSATPARGRPQQSRGLCECTTKRRLEMTRSARMQLRCKCGNMQR